MLNVIIETEGLSSSAKLKNVLEDRQSIVQFSNGGTKDKDKSEKIDASEICFLCSDKFLDRVNGQLGLIEKAKSLKANFIFVLAENRESFSIKEEMGGKLIYVTFPKEVQEEQNEDNYGLQMLATLITKNNHIISGDQTTKQLIRLAEKVSKTDVTVFINGPTGTGKEVLSKFIHNKSSRSSAPFVGINCAAIPENMLEAVLFGHEKGAFTGASSPNKGIFRAADGGTLLLDEISEMPLGLQAKILRVLQEKIVTPIGSQKDLPVDVRVIATTNRNMVEEISNGNFREDLYYRLNVFPLATSHLTNRKKDIIPLTTALLYRHCKSLEELPWLDISALNTLLNHSWPGNVRELENIVQRALVLCTEKQICSSDIVIDNNPLNKPQDRSIEQNTQRLAI
ncbi:sigma-54 dependent transcriptional regulator [Paracoccaceae bacterium]|nr:sigma-54 dependent transcriptional regulator [Paracoccaceae bacterium]